MLKYSKDQFLRAFEYTAESAIRARKTDTDALVKSLAGRLGVKHDDPTLRAVVHDMLVPFVRQQIKRKQGQK